MKKNLLPLVLAHDPVWAIESQRGMFLWKQLSLIDPDLHRAHFEAAKAEGALDVDARRGEGEPSCKPFEMYGDTAIVNISGPMMKSPSSFSSSVSTVYTRRLIRLAANDKDVKNILIRFDSPGGSVSGTSDLADEIASANRKKECIAYVEDCCCSAAYWCASQCSAIYANATAIVGSIGTYMVIEDWSRLYQNSGIDVHVICTGKFKGAGAEGAEVTSEQLAHFQKTVDDLNEHFLTAVARGRNMSRESLGEHADGRVWIGAEAETIGLIDGISALDDVLVSMQKSKARPIASAMHDNEFAEASSPPAGESFEQTLDSVLAAVERASERCESLRAIRAKQGRKLGSERLKQLHSIHASLGVLVEQCASSPIAEELPEANSEPEQQPATESPLGPKLQALKEVLDASRSNAA